MDIRQILVPVTGTDAGLPGLDAAFEVGRYLGAHVEALHARRNARETLAYIGEGMTGAMIEELITTAEQESETLVQRAEKDFAAACEGANFERTDARGEDNGSTAYLRIEVGREEDLLATRGRVADLIVVTRADKSAEAPVRTTLEAAVLESGRPVFVAPPNGIAKPMTGVAIGWNGSAEAARAVGHAMPFLVKAEQVAVISVEEGVRPGPSADDLVEYLAWHGVAASTDALMADYRLTGEAILTEAMAIEAGLLIMGAYTHTRLRRMIFGSATEYMFGEADIPVVMMN